MSFIQKAFPIVNWLPSYKKEYLSGDISAGLTVGVMLIPQGMAYAMIAGLPPVYGLYASIIPQIVYAIFGTSRQLSVGPVAMDSLLVAAGISTLAVVGTENYITLAILLSLMIGVIQLVFGIFRLGFIVNFLSKPVISGFTSAAALIIGLNQLKHITGIDTLQNSNVFKTMPDIFSKIDTSNLITLAIALLAIVVIRVAKKVHKAIPGALITVVAGIVAVKYAGLESLGVKIIGSIPGGLPSFSVPAINAESISELAPIALTLALIAFMEAISVGKALQANHKREYQIDNNQEMIGLGMANIFGSMFGSYPTTGGFSRSAVNDQAGAKTNMAAIISAVLVSLTLLFFTPMFYFLPKAILGAIIMVAVIGLIDLKYPQFLWKSKKQDLLMLVVTFVITLVFGIREGILAGVLVSLLALIYRTTNPHMAVLGKLPETTSYRNIERFNDIDERKDVLVLRHDAQLYFANTPNFIDSVKREVERKGENLRLIIFHCSSISSIDATALQALRELVFELNENNVGVYFSGVIGPVRDFLHKTGFIDDIGPDHFFTDIQPAIDYLDNGARRRNKQMLKRALQTNIFKEDEI